MVDLFFVTGYLKIKTFRNISAKETANQYKTERDVSSRNTFKKKDEMDLCPGAYHNSFFMFSPKESDIPAMIEKIKNAIIKHHTKNIKESETILEAMKD